MDERKSDQLDIPYEKRDFSDEGTRMNLLTNFQQLDSTLISEQTINSKILLILDLDGTLIHSEFPETSLSRPPDFILPQTGYYLFKRPHLSTFLQQIQSFFDLAGLYFFLEGSSTNF